MLECLFLSPQGIQKYEALASVSLPAAKGRMEVLSGHAESFVLLLPGDIVLGQPNGEKTAVTITGGECSITGKSVKIFTEAKALQS